MKLGVRNNTIVYVVCTPMQKTGGTELLHQLVRNLNSLEIKSYITYTGAKRKKILAPINPAFMCYTKTFVYYEDVVDTTDNIIILSETDTKKIGHFHNIRKIVWWLSVDNYFIFYRFNPLRYFGIKPFLLMLLRGNKINFSQKNLKRATLHLCQSHYSEIFLDSIDISNHEYLSDYINDIYIDAYHAFISAGGVKKDIVLYNPKKGFEFTSKLISQMPDIKWIAIENMNNEQVKDALLSAKVYIDFGNHPGKDRFPREAALCGCCIITGRVGSAAYYEDIPIPEKYKFEISENNLIAIEKCIRKCIEKYDDNSKCFSNYIDEIKKQKQEFIEALGRIFEKEEI